MANDTSSASAARPAWTDESGTLHEQYRAAVLLGAECLGEVSFDPGDHPDLHYRRTGIAYYCPECGDIWARVVFWDSSGRQNLLEAEIVSCENHADYWNVPGSLLSAGLGGLINLLPREAVKRELEIYLRRIT